MTANRELEKGAVETEGQLGSLKDQSGRDLLALRQKLDTLRESYAEMDEAREANHRRADELDVILGACARRAWVWCDVKR